MLECLKDGRPGWGAEELRKEDNFQSGQVFRSGPMAEEREEG